MADATVPIHEARNKLSALVDRVEAGETITLTRHGRKVALLVPVDQAQPNGHEAIAQLRALRGTARLGGLKVKDLRDEGRP